MKLTARQEEIVAHRGSTLLVSASAGSGKTEVLARRCLGLLNDSARPCGVDQLLVVTFTRAAAAELRVRIAGMLHEAALGENNARRRHHLERQAILIDSAEIDTIDAWCGRLVREHFEIAGVDPAFAVMGEEEAALLKRETLDAVFDELHAGTDELSLQIRAWVGRAAKPSDQYFRDAVGVLHDFRDHLVDPEEWHARQFSLAGRSADQIRDDAQTILAAALQEECRFQLEELASLIPSIRDERVVPAMRDYGAALLVWSQELEIPTKIGAVAESIVNFKFPRRPANLPDSDIRLWTEIKERWLERRLRERAAGAAIKAIVENGPAANELVLLLLRIERRFNERLTAEKRRRSALSFGDIQRLALQVLRDSASGGPTDVACGLRDRYAHVLVDEVQDTSPLQFEMLRLITREDAGRTNAFLVGDVKQSIYGFREAEPRLFAERVAAANGGAVDAYALSLSDNFRSHAGVLDPLNDAFAALFHARVGGLEYDDASRLRALRSEIENPTLDLAARVELHVVDPPKDTADTPESAPEEIDGGDADVAETADSGEEMPLARIERETAIAAERIHALIANATIPEKQPDGTLAMRPIRFGDIVILLRSARGNAALAAAALRAAGVPSVAVGRESMLDSLQVADVRNILTLLTNRRQDLSLAAYLRGPFGGLSTDDLMELRLLHPMVPFHEAVLRASDSGEGIGQTKARCAMQQLESWTRAARSVDLPELIRRIVRDCSMRLFAQALPGGEHRVAMLQALQNYADEFAATGQAGVAEFIDHLDALDATQLRPGASTAAGDDVVRIMTVHASKGLEFPVVLMMNCGAWFSRRPRGAALRCDAELGIGLRFFDYPNQKEIATAAAPLLEARGLSQDLDEELRLLYVAATRAREKLIFIGHGKQETWEDLRVRLSVPGSMPPLMDRLNAKSLLDWLLMGFAADGAGRIRSAMDMESAGSGMVGLFVHTDPIGIGGTRAKQAEKSQQSIDEQRAENQIWIEKSTRLLSVKERCISVPRPAVISVGGLKDRLAGEDAATDWIPRESSLPPPAFAADQRPADGRDRGVALHRFLEHAEFAKIADENGVRGEVERLLQSQRLSSSEAALLDIGAIAWLGATSPIRLAGVNVDRCRREIPFVYALPGRRSGDSTIVRGVIDCMMESDDGLMLLDYKTDRVRDGRDFGMRVDKYETQIRVYALAAGILFRKPVRAAHLLFLEPRKVVTVDVSEESIGKLLAELDNALG